MTGNVDAIAIRDLVKRYRGAREPALKGVTLGVGRGELFGLLGPNGAGKTTLISILCGMMAPSAGGAFIHGVDASRRSARAGKTIGWVPQDIALYPSLTARENLRFFGHMHGLGGVDLDRRVALWLERIGMESSADRRVSTFSGGMKRRVNLAAGALHDPELLILDEPTVGIDPQSRNLVFETLKQLNKSGVTMLYTTHHLSEAEHFCSRVAILDRGELLAEGTPAALLQSRKDCKNLEDVFFAMTGKEIRE